MDLEVEVVFEQLDVLLLIVELKLRHWPNKAHTFFMSPGVYTRAPLEVRIMWLSMSECLVKFSHDNKTCTEARLAPESCKAVQCTCVHWGLSYFGLGW